MPTDYRCSVCKIPLDGDIEIDTGVCGQCADSMYEREQERREWDYYHPADDKPKRKAKVRR